MRKTKNLLPKLTPKKILLILAAVLAGVLIGVSVRYLTQDKKNDDVKTGASNGALQTSNSVDSTGQSDSIPEQSSTLPPSDDPAYAGWKSYSSPRGFSFRYPPSWTFSDDTDGSNQALALSLQTKPDKLADNLHVSIGVLDDDPLPSYPAESTIKTMSNSLRLWTSNVETMSEHYKSGEIVACATARLMDSSANTDIRLPQAKRLNSDASFCFNQNDYATKTYDEQLASQEWRDLVKVYESIKVQ